MQHKKTLTPYLQGRNLLLKVSEPSSHNFLSSLFLFSQSDEEFDGSRLVKAQALFSAIESYMIKSFDCVPKRLQLGQVRESHSRNILQGIMELDCQKAWKKAPPPSDTITVVLDDQEVLTKLTIALEPSYKRKKPFALFHIEQQHCTVEFVRDEQAKAYYQQASERNLITKLYLASGLETRKHILLDEVPCLDLLKYGSSILKNIDLYAPVDEETLANERPFCFPLWGQQRLDEIEATHPVITPEKERELVEGCHTSLWDASAPSCAIESCDQCHQYFTYRKQGNCGREIDCSICHEYLVWLNLKWWYNEVFIRAFKTKQDHKAEGSLRQEFMLPDGSVVQGSPRLKALVIKGPRLSGKTKFFEALCGFRKHRIVKFKNRFNKEGLRHVDTAWLLLIEDFSYKEDQDLQTLKALVAGEDTVIEGKWLSHFYSGGLPCVILCNEEDLYWYLYGHESIRTQCKFIDLGEKVWLGPPGYDRNFITVDKIPDANLTTLEKYRNACAKKGKRHTKKRQRDFDKIEEEDMEDDEEICLLLAKLVRKMRCHR